MYNFKCIELNTFKIILYILKIINVLMYNVCVYINRWTHVYVS